MDGKSRSSRRWQRLLTGLLLLTVAFQPGCAYVKGWARHGFKVGPNYCKPAAPIADTWIDEYDQRIIQELPPCEDWWSVFNDPQLSELICNMYRQNLTLKSIGLRVLQSRYQLAIAVGSLFPQSQRAFGEYSRTQISKNAFPINQFPFPTPRAFDNFAFGFDAFWELDFWGKFRRNVESANNNVDANIEGYDAALVVLLAETAATYVDMRTIQQRLTYARQNIEIQEGSLDIAKVKYRNGGTTELDVTQAETNLQNTKQLVPLLEAQLRATNNRLCVLLGIPPRDLTCELGDGPIPTAPPEVAVGVPCNLLRRRPDIRQAERLVAVQSAQIGVAAADMLPHFSIRGAFQWQAEDFSNLFNQQSFGGFVGPGFSWDILNYGRILSNVKLQDARFEQLAVDYQQKVLEANAETETGITNFLKAQERLRETEQAVVAAKKSVDLALTQYRDGATDFNRVFNLQTALTQQQDTVASVQGDVARSLIAVYKALGGGWQIRLGAGSGPQGPIQMLPPVTQAEPVGKGDGIEELPALPQGLRLRQPE